MILSSKQLLGLILTILAIFFINIPIDIMDVDAAQYASISMEMAQNNSFLEVYHLGNDYLDKPPILFWITALFIKIFGVSTWSYKLPALIIILSGIYATYRFALLYYPKRTSILAALITMSTQSIFLITNDVRMDGIFMSFVMLAFWQTGNYLQYKKLKNLLFGAIWIACALMAKGPLALIIFLAGFGFQFLLTKSWKAIFNLAWILFFMTTAICLIPMCYGLYTQFDLHPEKHVYGLDGPSGIKFFFWTQSFGRITGDIYWNNGLPWHFFITSILWDLQPWAFFFYPAFFIRIKEIIQKRTTREYITIGAFLFPFIALSLSRFKLPHYVFPLFPFAAIIISSFLNDTFESLSWKKVLYIIQYFILSLFLIIPIIAFILFFDPTIFDIILWGITFFMAITIFIKNNNSLERVIRLTFVCAIGFNAIMGIYFYPNLLEYQSESKAAQYTLKNKPKDVKFYRYKTHSHALDFYSGQIVPSLSDYPKSISQNSWIFTNESGKDILQETYSNCSVISSFYDFHITGLNLPFLMKETRESQCSKTYLIAINF